MTYRHANVRWWTAPPDDGRLAPVIISTSDQEPALLRAMYDLPPPGRRYLYVPLFDRTLWLRNSVEIRGYKRP